MVVCDSHWEKKQAKKIKTGSFLGDYQQSIIVKYYILFLMAQHLIHRFQCALEN